MDERLNQTDEQEEWFPGAIANCRKRYLMTVKPKRWKEIVESGKEDEYLRKYEEEYEPKLARLISDLMERHGVTEELRSQNWLEYVQRGTAVHSQAWELMREEIQS